MTIKLDTPLLHKFYDWAMKQKNSREVTHHSWDTCFVGKFHRYDNGITKPFNYLTDEHIDHDFMPIYKELFNAGLIFCDNSISNLSTFGELKTHLKLHCEKV
jgi:hypothetical protein